MNCVKPLSALCLLLVSIACHGQTIVLDGIWDFRFNNGATTSITVPGNWEMQGFCEPQYGKDLKDNHGIYSRKVTIPKSWKGKRVLIDLDGVCFGYTLKVNGKDFGSFASAFTVRTHDITRAIRFGRDNDIVVDVCTHPKGYEFDTNDDWSLSGISRHVVLYARPQNYIKSMTIDTHMDGTVDVDCQFSEKEIPFTTEVLGLKGTPKLWTAETPNLYTLRITTKYETRDIRIGFREVGIIDGVFCINGKPVKLRGATHHDLSPLNGRAITREETLRDLIMMKRGNMNYVRTSHYPPTQDLLSLCDSLGIYVMCEVPFGYGDEHLTDSSYTALLKERAYLTVTAHRNHPSVVVWSVGNENPVTPSGLATGEYVHRLDPSRPYLFPQRGSLFKSISGKSDSAADPFMRQVPMYAPHYPSANDVKNWSNKFDRPLIITEYAHSLGTDMGRMQDIWHIVRDSPRLAGGSVWELFDQGLLRKADTPVNRDSITDYAWTSPTDYYDTKSDLGTDGILYADRTPQTDYFQVRKVYSPVFIPDTVVSVNADAPSLDVQLPVFNYFDFTDLSRVKARWELVSDGATISSGNIHLAGEPHSSSTLRISTQRPSPRHVSFLRISFTDESGYQFYERNIKISHDADIFDIFSREALKTDSVAWLVQEIHPERFVKIGRKSTMSERATMAGGQGKKHRLAAYQLAAVQPITDEETTEIGSAIIVPDSLCIVTWVGQGPYASYPGKTELSEYGIWQVDRDGLYFPGNRQGVELMCLTNRQGKGIVIVPEQPTDISLETRGRETIVSVNAREASPYNKNVWPTGTIRLDQRYPLPQFRVYEVSNPVSLLNLKPSICDVHHFYHVYDR